MLRRVRRSLGFRLTLAMMLPVVVLAVPAFFVINHLELAHQRTTSVSDDQEEASTIAAAGPGVTTNSVILANYQRLLGDDQLIVRRSSQQVFRGPPNPDPRHFTVGARVGATRVTIVGDVESTAGLSLELTVIAAGALLLVAMGAFAGTQTAVRSIRVPVRKAADVADRVSSGDLSAKVGDVGSHEFFRLADALDTMTARLGEADQAQRRFLADLAHEIATPLSSIASLAMAVLDGTIGDDASRAEAAHLLEGETARLRGLLDDLAHLRRLDLAESVSFQRVELRSLLGEVVTRFRPDARGAGVDLRTLADGTPLELDTDPRLVETVVGNLVANAIRYTPAGGRVRVSAERRGDRAMLAVRDSGVGIPAEEQPKIFDRFYRVDKSRGREGGGTGLGLSIALRAATAVGGRIEFDSEPGAGSEFRLTLPLATVDGDTEAADATGDNRGSAGGLSGGAAGR
jgi:signal transduction histidine kinase